MLNGTDEKKQYFNQYWKTRDISSADLRSIQRADIIQTLFEPDKNKKIIDVGCGRGTVMRQLFQSGFNVNGCDISSDTIRELSQSGFDAFLCDLETDPIPGKYDVLMCLEVLQQIFDPEAVIAKMRKALNPGGYLIISVPNEFHILSRLKLLLGKSHLGHFEESHIRLFSPGRARELFDKCGLTIDKTISVSVVPPKLKALQAVGRFIARLIPGLFSLSQIYRLKIK
ncbi:MAG: class I SAM-dependent methyltransferase [candidate division Zixibacteria bacterium]|nr:class I SAM-dependent methyltransferase [candidate division Zixibacteria bacterium]